MIVECSQCGWHYDDAKRWTICPHNLLEYSPSTPYCHEHDLYNCPHHSAQLASAPNPKSEAAAKCMTVLALVALLYGVKMGYYVSNMFGIRCGGVFSGNVDREDMRQRIAKLVLSMRETDFKPNLGGEDGNPDHCLSKRLESSKGEYVVLAGVCNYWTYESSSEFAKRLSEEFGTEVMHMCWDEELNTVQCQVWLGGKPLFEVEENPIGRLLRRIAG